MLLDQVYTKIMALFSFNKAVVNTGAKAYILRVYDSNQNAINFDIDPTNYDEATFTGVTTLTPIRRAGEKSLRYSAALGYFEVLRAIEGQQKITLRTGAVASTDADMIRLLTRALIRQVCWISEDNKATWKPVYYDGTEIELPSPGAMKEYELPFVYSQITLDVEA